MPRLGKKARIEWSFFIGSNRRRQYNELCRRCKGDCKQSFRAIILDVSHTALNAKKCSAKVRFGRFSLPLTVEWGAARVFSLRVPFVNIV